MEGGILVLLGGGGGRDARMRERDDEVDALLMDLGQIGADCLDDVARIDLAAQMRVVPLHDLRRHDADYAELNLYRVAGLVRHLALKDQVRLQVGLIEAGIGAERAPDEM